MKLSCHQENLLNVQPFSRRESVAFKWLKAACFFGAAAAVLGLLALTTVAGCL